MSQPQPAHIGHNNPPSLHQGEDLTAHLEHLTGDARTLITKLETEANEVPEVIADEIQAAKYTDLMKEIQIADSAYEKVRKAEKDPYFSASKLVDDFFRSGANKLAIAKAKIQKPLTAYAKKKADEERAAALAEAARLQAKAEEEAAQARALEQVGLKDHADVQLHQATKTEAQAIKAANQTVAQLSTVRGVSAMSGLRTRWVATITDKNALDLEKLRPYLKIDHLQVALNAYMAAGGRVITGATIAEDSTINVR